MPSNDILDQPHHKRLSGLDLKINRYHIINPVNDELLIMQLPSKGKTWMIAAILVLALCGLFVWFTIEYLAMRETGIAMGMFGFVLLLAGMLGYVIYLNYANKARWHFTPTDMFHTNPFGIKRTFRRSQIKSVFVQSTKHYSNGAYNGTTHDVRLRVPGWKRENSYQLLNVGREDAQGPNDQYNTSAQKEALQMAGLIAEHWKIPVSTFN